jgi:hypothetical protein
MERHRFFVELFTRPYGPDGATVSNSDEQWETVVECRNPNEGERMVQSQYGGPNRARVVWRGPA